MKTLIQVAGIIDKGEAELMVECGVDGRKDRDKIVRFVQEARGCLR